VHLGWDDTAELGWSPRSMPDLPNSCAMRLKVRLEEIVDDLYLVPSSGIKGLVITGEGELLENSKRETYGQMTRILDKLEIGKDDHRHFILSNAERAFVDEAHRDLTSEDFLLAIQEETRRIPSIVSSPKPSLMLTNPPPDNMKIQGRTVQAQVDRLMSMIGQQYASYGGKTIDKDQLRQNRFQLATLFYDTETEISVKSEEDNEKKEVEEEDRTTLGLEIRWAFCRFWTTILLRYKAFMHPDPSGEMTFQKEAFLRDLHLSRGNQLYMASVLDTQMFENFLQQRRVGGPKRPQNVLFDEFLITKQNRSWGQKNKQPTPFMDDERWKVNEIISPAPPYSAGVLWGSVHKYRTFPKLRPKEFVSNNSGSSLTAICSDTLCSSLAFWDS